MLLSAVRRFPGTDRRTVVIFTGSGKSRKLVTMRVVKAPQPSMIKSVKLPSVDSAINSPDSMTTTSALIPRFSPIEFAVQQLPTWFRQVHAEDVAIEDARVKSSDIQLQPATRVRFRIKLVPCFTWQPFGMEQGEVIGDNRSAGKKLSTMRCRSIPMAIAWRTSGSLNGSRCWSFARYRIFGFGSGNSTRFGIALDRFRNHPD